MPVDTRQRLLRSPMHLMSKIHWTHALLGGWYPLSFHQLFGGCRLAASLLHQLLGTRLGPLCWTESLCCSTGPATASLPRICTAATVAAKMMSTLIIIPSLRPSAQVSLLRFGRPDHVTTALVRSKN